MSEALARVKGASDLKLWVPESYGRLAEERVQKAVKEYDERLILARHQHTGDWCLFISNGPFGGDPYPVIGLGVELPHEDDVLKLVHKYDAVRQGDNILKAINRGNQAIWDAHEAAASEATEVIAEAQESFLHAQGRTPYRRIYAPKKKTAVAGH